MAYCQIAATQCPPAVVLCHLLLLLRGRAARQCDALTVKLEILKVPSWKRPEMNDFNEE